MIAIVDYGMGNLRSVQKAFARFGHDAVIVTTSEGVAKADRLVLPGVGAMKDAMQALRDNDLVEPIREFIKSGKPFLGICLGLQMLFDVSYEDGEHPGLGVFAGSVRKFEVPRPLKVPHMGWNSLNWLRRPPIAKDVKDDGYAYFVHSYYVDPTDRSIVAAETDYGGPFASICWKDNVVATQFHPEKSQSVGLKLLDGFATS
jgi:imidazole glycerol-phosphate synthase subunit HisH